MRKFLPATTAAAVVLTFTGRAFAETNLQLCSGSPSPVPSETTGQGSAEAAKPAEPAAKPAPVELSPLSSN